LVRSIEKEIQKSGFPLEMHVLNICSTKNTGRMPNFRYEHKGQQREIDLLAFFETMAPSHHTSTDLIIECKKTTEKPWVFFSTPSYTFENVIYFTKYASEFDVYFKKHEMLPLLAQIYSRMPDRYYDRKPSRCISYCEAFRSTSTASDNIYRAIDSVITALNYRYEARLPRLEEFGDFSEFYLPIIVVDGFLFEAAVESDKVIVNARSHVQLRTFHDEDVYIVDVVTRDHFPEFFEEIEKFHNRLVECIASLKFPKTFKMAARVRKEQQQQSFQLRGKVHMTLARQKAQPRERKQ